MDFKIVDVFIHDSQLVVKAQHYHPSAPGEPVEPWFVEHYTWQGREGSKRQRRVNALGEPLLDDGSVALKVTPPDGRVAWFLPSDRQWAYNARPRMSEASVLGVIQETHRQRLATGWPQGKVDVLGRFKSSAADEAGVAALLLHLGGLKGRSV